MLHAIIPSIVCIHELYLVSLILGTSIFISLNILFLHLFHCFFIGYLSVLFWLPFGYFNISTCLFYTLFVTIVVTTALHSCP